MVLLLFKGRLFKKDSDYDNVLAPWLDCDSTQQRSTANVIMQYSSPFNRRTIQR